jgi:hypothetical protein
LFSSWIPRPKASGTRPVALLKRRFGRQTSSRWRFSRKNAWVVQGIPQQAIEAILALSTRNIVTGRQKLADATFYCGLRPLRFLYGGVLCVHCGWAWSGELQGPILHEMVPTTYCHPLARWPAALALVARGIGLGSWLPRAQWPVSSQPSSRGGGGGGG